MRKLIYANIGGTEAHEPTRRDLELLTRRAFIRRSSLFLPLAWLAGGFLAGSTQRAKGASTIISRTISAANQNAISMANSTWARPVALPSSWSKIRIGCRMHMTNTGANLTANAIFAMGFCNGTTAQYGDASTQHWIGRALDVTTWTYQAGPPVTYQLNPGGSCDFARVRLGTSNTSSTLYADGAQSLINAAAATATADRMLLFLDITKGSPNYTFHLPFRCISGPGAGADVTAANFLLYMGQVNPTPSEGGYDTTAINLASPTLAVNEGLNGALNAINFYWNRADATLEICDVAVAVLA